MDALAQVQPAQPALRFNRDRLVPSADECSVLLYSLFAFTGCYVSWMIISGNSANGGAKHRDIQSADTRRVWR